MPNNFQVSVLDESAQRGVTVLRVASAARNSVSQFYPQRVQVAAKALAHLHEKILDKLRLHRVESDEVEAIFSVQFENHKTISFTKFDEVTAHALQVPAVTQLVTAKWTFICDLDGDGQKHAHSVYVRISERPHPGLILQKALSGQGDDLESLDSEAFSAVACKIDFIDNRFSNELLAIVTEWVESLPKAEESFGVIKWCLRNEDAITSLVFRLFPSLMLLGYAGLWVILHPTDTALDGRIAVAWILGGGVIYETSKFVAGWFNNFFQKMTRRILNVPVFQITSGDQNKMTAFLARSQNSIYKLLGASLLIGALKAVGGILATRLLG